MKSIQIIIRALLIIILTSPIWFFLLLMFLEFGEHEFTSLHFQLSVFTVFKGVLLFCLFWMFIPLWFAMVKELIKEYTSTLQGISAIYLFLSSLLLLKAIFEIVSWKLKLTYFIEKFCSSDNLQQSIILLKLFFILFIICLTLDKLTRKFFHN